MKKDRIAERLQETIVVPDIVQQRADLVLAQIRKESIAEREGGKQMRYAGRRMWAAVAAAVLVLGLGTVACAVYLHWSRGMEEWFDATPEQKEYLEETRITVPMNDSVT